MEHTNVETMNKVRLGMMPFAKTFLPGLGLALLGLCASLAAATRGQAVPMFRPAPVPVFRPIGLSSVPRLPSNRVLLSAVAAAPAAGLTAAPPALSAPWSASLGALWGAGGARVYNAKTDARLPAHPAGGGRADDRLALQADLNFISGAGGGVLYLPAGAYLVDNSAFALTLGGRAALLGDGPGKTILISTSVKGAFINFSDANTAGLCNLSLATAAPPTDRAFAVDGSRVNTVNTFGVTRNFFLKFVAVNFGNGGPIATLSGSTNYTIEDCRLSAPRSENEAVNISGVQGLTLYRNQIQWLRRRVYLLANLHVKVIGNTFARDMRHDGPGTESGNGPDVSYCEDLEVGGNTFVGLGLSHHGYGYNEAILTQNDLGNPPGAQRFQDAGALSSISGTVLTDVTKNWGAWLVPPLTGQPVLCVLSGANVGQWRYVTSHSAHALTLASALPLPSSPGDLYCVTAWTAKDFNLHDNVFVNCDRGIEIYDGALNVAASTNTLINSEALILIGWDFPGGIHEPVWGCTLTDNTVSNPDGGKWSAIGFLANQQAPAAHGNILRGNNLIGNTAVSHPPGSTPLYDLQGADKDGLYNSVVANVQAATAGHVIADHIAEATAATGAP